MSVKVYAVVSRHSKATGNARVVLQLLADAADDNGRIRIAAATLAQRANVTAKTIARAVVRLVELGEVVVEQVGTGHLSTVYRVNLTALAVTPGSTQVTTLGTQDGHPRVDEGVDQDGSYGSSQAAAREPEPVIDQRDEPAVAEFVRCRPRLTDPRRVWARSLSEVERDRWRQRARPARAPALQPVEPAAARSPVWTPPQGWRALVAAQRPS